ncbi:MULTISPECIES: NosD domain-containing protein [unclassified Rhizobium]|uniref:NosD domain-containing protein n=1 Tax=unclassified Rhizobium TaxID=2613769 RepID=UPI001613AF2B|nr:MULTISPECIES: NosD domain-containing protein [unclassified Rhizobium]MBB3288751.1 hypothetical protein [Rhizobium sp. BK252]MBB3403493.1 hypothetical protein [Rhizobium sp. BK289]MBB3416322.1 hypothetical protein [Rhizobium sp. BK284]MBB3483956.1 hypothetical protein [Rhizobium sp. BK347]
MTSILIDRTDGLASAVAIKGPCRAATTGNISLYALQTIDGVALADGDRVLVKDQTAAYENGIYVADTGQWRRAKDFNRNNDVRTGTLILVTSGTANAGNVYQIANDNPIVIGTTLLSIVETDFSAASIAGPLPTTASRYIRRNDAGTAYEALTAQQSANIDELRDTNPGTAGLTILGHSVAADTRDFLDVPPYVASRTALKALDTSKDGLAIFDGSVWERVNTVAYSALITADTQEGLFALSTFNTSFAWRRRYNGPIRTSWFQTAGDGVTDDRIPLTGWLTMAGLIGLGARIDAASHVCSAILSITTSKNILITGESEELSIILFTGSTAGIKLKSSKYSVGSSTTADSRPFFGARDFTMLTSNTAGTQDALSFEFPYFHSSQHREYDISNVTIGVISAQQAGGQKWRNAIRIRNGWNGHIGKITANQHADIAANYSGSAVYLDGLSPSANIHDCNFQWWNTAVENTYMVLKKLVGTVTGSFWMHEIVTGGTSGATARVARFDGYGGSNLAVMEVTGTFINGETVTGQSTGATIVLSSAPTDMQQSNEGLYFQNSDAVACNYGILSLQPSTAVTPGVGLWVVGSHFNVQQSAIFTQYHHQQNIIGNLVYPQGSTSVGFSIDNGGNNTISGNTLLGPGGNATGIGLSNSASNSVVGNSIQNFVTGIAIAATVTNSKIDASNTFVSCTTNISNLGPNWPTANWNTVEDDIWYAYVSTMTAASGTITTKSASGRFRKRGKTIEICITGSITTNGTGAGSIFCTLPGGIAASSVSMLSGRGTAVSGVAISGQVSGASVNIVTATAAYPGSDGYAFTISGVYEIP